MSIGSERRKTLESFGRSPALLCAALREFPRKMWLHKPSAQRWSIHEIILHLADSEASAYIFCRHFIAEPGIAPVEFDAARWADSLGYFHQSTREALEIIRRLSRYRSRSGRIRSSIRNRAKYIWGNGWSFRSNTSRIIWYKCARTISPGSSAIRRGRGRLVRTPAKHLLPRFSCMLAKLRCQTRPFGLFRAI